jgi:hypothetical protein
MKRKQSVDVCGVRSVRMIGIDPPPLGASVPRGVDATNFVGVMGGRIAGAHNIPVSGYSHLYIRGGAAMPTKGKSIAIIGRDPCYDSPTIANPLDRVLRRENRSPDGQSFYARNRGSSGE